MYHIKCQHQVIYWASTSHLSYFGSMASTFRGKQGIYYIISLLGTAVWFIILITTIINLYCGLFCCWRAGKEITRVTYWYRCQLYTLLPFIVLEKILTVSWAAAWARAQAQYQGKKDLPHVGTTEPLGLYWPGSTLAIHLPKVSLLEKGTGVFSNRIKGFEVGHLRVHWGL